MAWNPRRLRARTLLAYLPALVVILVATVVVSGSFERTQRYSAQVLESTRLIGLGNELLRNMAIAQSGVRGFALVGEEAYLDPYRRADYELRRRQASVDSDWQGRPEERDKVTRALALFSSWREETAEPVIDARRSPAAETTGLLIEGVATMAEADGLLRGVVRHEQRLLRERTVQNARAAGSGAAIALGAPLVALGYVLLAAYLLTRRTLRAIEGISTAAGALATGDLSRRVAAVGDDEIAAMAQTFNLMAERLGERSSQAQRLIDLAQLLQVSLTVQEIGELFEHFVPRLVRSAGGRLYLRDPGRQLLVRLAGWGPSGAETFESTACWAVRVSKAYRSTGGDGPPCGHVGSDETYRSVCVPMVVHGDALGMVQYLYEPGEAEEAIVRAGSEVAERFAFTLSNLALRERLRDQSVRDPLTGLYNRRYLDEMAEREIERSRRSGAHLGVLLLDIDRFKQLNDTDGHDAGDAVLMELGRLLSTVFRAGDEAFRYGGEEFVVLMPGASSEEVIERANGLRQRIARLRAVSGGKVIRPITASMGVSSFPEDGNTPAELLRAADEALYRAKAAGRDRICGGRGGREEAIEPQVPELPEGAPPAP